MQNSFFPVYVVMSLVMGSLLSIYLPMNASVGRHLGSPITANLTLFAVAFTSALVIFLVWGNWSSLHKITAVPRWLFLCGVISAFMILGTTFLLPKIGARQLFVLLVSGQILMSMIVSHYGFWGLPKDPVTLKKSIGAGLVLAGIILSVV